MVSTTVNPMSNAEIYLCTLHAHKNTQTALLISAHDQSPMFCNVVYNKARIRGGPKSKPPCRQILTDFHNSFTGTLSSSRDLIRPNLEKSNHMILKSPKFTH